MNAPLNAFDFVIVGAGSAGCVLANRLSADPCCRVLLIEAGGPDRHPLIHVPGGMIFMLQRAMFSWTYETEPQEHLENRVLMDVRGKVLGGSSSINGMQYCRGAPDIYDGWALAGNRGWGYKEVLHYFKLAERHENGESEFHGGAGPLPVTQTKVTDPLSRAWIEAGLQAGFSYSDDLNGQRFEGFGPTQTTTWKGRRMSTAVAYLKSALPRKNLKVMTGARVSRVLTRAGRARGVEVLHDGQTIRVEAEREVLLSAGTYNSPQILMLSGIGDGAQLRRVGIDAKVELKGVGQNLHDHFGFSVQVACPLPITNYSYFSNPLAAVRAIGQYALLRQGPLASSGTEAIAYVRSGCNGVDKPDLKFMLIPIMVDGNSGKPLQQHGVMNRLVVIRPKSRGAVKLRSSDPLAPPAINANYLSAAADLDVARRGIELAREVFAQPAYARYRGAEMLPGPDITSAADIDAYLKRTGSPNLEAAGTCKMGNDPLAVVDEQLRVHGVEGLRVVDASIMPQVSAADTNAPTIMIAEKAAELIQSGVPSSSFSDRLEYDSVH